MKKAADRLSELYELRRKAQRLGIRWTQEQENQLLAEEESIIRQEVLPLVTQSLEPALHPVERELVLVVEHIPGAPLKVSLSRKRNLFDAITDAVTIEPDPKANHRSFGPQKRAKEAIAPKTRLRVTMPDGAVIEHSKAKDTFAEVVRRIGPDRIRTLGLSWCKVPFISNTIDGKYAQSPVGDGWYVITHSGTADKRKQLLRIAHLLNISLTVDIIQ